MIWTFQLVLTPFSIHSRYGLQRREKKACAWLREFSSYSCLTAMPGSAWVLLSKTCKPFFRSSVWMDNEIKTHSRDTEASSGPRDCTCKTSCTRRGRQSCRAVPGTRTPGTLLFRHPRRPGRVRRRRRRRRRQTRSLWSHASSLGMRSSIVQLSQEARSESSVELLTKCP